MPGKLMLTGEYAVLGGAPAVLVSVDRRVTARGERLAGTAGRVTARAGGTLGGEFQWRDDRLHWSPAEAAGDLRLVAHLLAEFVPGEGWVLEIDSSAAFAAGRKLGIGSSAAVAVALGAVLAGDLEPATVRRIAAAHRRFQGGLGSGADIHAVAQGGAVIWPGRDASAEPRPVPNGLHLCPVLGTASASTVDRVARFERWAAQAPAGAGALQDLAEQAASVWRRASTDGIIRALRDYRACMLDLSERAGLEYLAGGHAARVAATETGEVVYKPCGAGGGDVGIAAATDPAALAAFVADVRHAGGQVPDWTLGVSAPEWHAPAELSA